MGNAPCKRSHQSERQRTLRLPSLLHSLKAEHPWIPHHFPSPTTDCVNHLAVRNQCAAELTVPAVQQVLEPLRHGEPLIPFWECSIPPEFLDLRGAFASEAAGRPPST